MHAGTDDIEQLEELVHRFTVALSLLQSLEPVGVGARHLAECLQLQCQDHLRENPDDEVAQVVRFIRGGGAVVSAGWGGGVTRCAGWRLTRTRGF
mgnify:CR=1 FL=1